MQVTNTLPADAEYDVVVVGAGGAGLSAALFAAIDGARVLIVEHTEFVGGTTAWSAGTTWVPGTHHGTQLNPTDTLEAAGTYLDAAIGNHAHPAMRAAFLQYGAEAVQRIETHSEVRYRPCAKHPDYISDLPGSTINGRALEPLPFDARKLGRYFGLVRPPIPEFTVLGGMMVDRNDINNLLAMTRSWAALRHSAKIIGRHARDRIRYPRGTRWVMGNALVGRLLYSLSLRPNVTLALQNSVCDLGAATLPRTLRIACTAPQGPGKHGGQSTQVRVRKGVILASGGFNRNPQLREKMLPGADIAWCPAAPGHTGEAHHLALQQGAHYAEGGASNAFWAPVSLRQRADGSTAVFPHFVMDRAKPGFITVNQAGQRFVNESTSYHLFGLAMQDAQRRNGGSPSSIPAYLICDADALQRYGMGMVRPGGGGLQAFLDDGYLTSAPTLAELARKLGIAATGLEASVAQMNRYAENGDDPEFKRGVTAYQQNIGDATRGGKNPNLGPIAKAPFYAVRLFPGDIGASTGFATNANGCMLDGQGQPMPGLYAIGNDMQSIMGGVYTAPGITIGPGLVFAYLATRHMRAAGAPT